MMYSTVLLIIYLAVLLPSLVCLIHFRHSPAARRVSAGLGVAGLLLSAPLAAFLCDLLVYVFSIGMFFAIILGAIGFMVKSARR